MSMINNELIKFEKTSIYLIKFKNNSISLIKFKKRAKPKLFYLFFALISIGN